MTLCHDESRSQHDERSAAAAASNAITAVVRVTLEIKVPWKPQVAALVAFKSASFALVLARLVEGIALLDVVRLFTGNFGGVV
jgi:hypothetical protein